MSLIGLSQQDISTVARDYCGIGGWDVQHVDSVHPDTDHQVFVRMVGGGTLAIGEHVLRAHAETRGLVLRQLVPTTLPVIIGHVYVCQDCMISRENGEAPEVCEYEPWSQLSGADVAADFSAEDGELSFSDATCDGCATHLAGERFRYALFGIGR